MEVNVKKIREILKEMFKGNQTAFAEALEIDRTHLNKVLRNNGKNAGTVFCGKFIKFCKKNNLNYEDYIFFN